MSSPEVPVRSSTSGPYLLVGLVLASLLCVLCYVAPVLWVAEYLAAPADDYAGLGLVIGGISIVLVSVPTLLVVIAWVLAARARATVAGWLLLVASLLLVLAAPTAAGQLFIGGLVLVTTLLALAAVACAITALVRGRRRAAGR